MPVSVDDRVKVVSTPLRCIFWILPVLFYAGCATFRVQAPPPQSTDAAPAQVAPASSADTVATVPRALPGDQVADLLRQSATRLKEGRRTDAKTSLDRATTLVTALVSSGDEGNAGYRLGGMLRVTLELYHDLMPKASPVAPDSPLAHLLLALSPSLAAELETHPFYQAFGIRRLAGTSDVPIDYMPEVVESIQYFKTAGREAFSRWLSRSGAYLPMIRENFREEGLPLDLAYNAMIESGFNPRAYSSARAAGVWQFVPRTAVLYGLRRDTWVDERRDPEKSTRAAARHLRNLHDLFGDWRLTVAAYNCGQGRLQRAIKKAGTRDFWKLKQLPRETRMHVPRFMAAVIISKDPEAFGFVDVDYKAPMAYDVVSVSECVDLKVASECALTSYQEIGRLNPELTRGYTPPVDLAGNYALRVPKGATETFRTNYAKVPPSRKVRMVDYVVRHGDTVSGIAQRLGVSTRSVLETNRIRNPRRLRIGSRLKVPVRPERHARARENAHVDGRFAATPSSLHYFSLTYKIRDGDTLWDIARKHDVTVGQLRSWNRLARSHSIHPGAKLVIWQPRYAVATAIRLSKDGAGRLYTVRRGDTLWEIARTFGTSVRDLERWNGIQDPSRLRPGTSLRIDPVDRSTTD